jgi:hypothetical protein
MILPVDKTTLQSVRLFTLCRTSAAKKYGHKNAVGLVGSFCGMLP